MVPVGTWRSLVAHLLGVQGVASSNLAVPTINLLGSFARLRISPGGSRYAHAAKKRLKFKSRRPDQ